MDAEQLEFQKEREAILVMRAEWEAKLAGHVADTSAEIESIAGGGNRLDRRRAKKQLQALAKKERRFQREIDTLFHRLTSGVDLDAGTLTCVQDEAETRLAAIFG